MKFLFQHLLLLSVMTINMIELDASEKNTAQTGEQSPSTGLQKLARENAEDQHENSPTAAEIADKYFEDFNSKDLVGEPIEKPCLQTISDFSDSDYSGAQQNQSPTNSVYSAEMINKFFEDFTSKDLVGEQIELQQKNYGATVECKKKRKEKREACLQAISEEQQNQSPTNSVYSDAQSLSPVSNNNESPQQNEAKITHVKMIPINQSNKSSLSIALPENSTNNPSLVKITREHSEEEKNDLIAKIYAETAKLQNNKNEFRNTIAELRKSKQLDKENKAEGKDNADNEAPSTTINYIRKQFGLAPIEKSMNNNSDDTTVEHDTPFDGNEGFRNLPELDEEELLDFFAMITLLQKDFSWAAASCFKAMNNAMSSAIEKHDAYLASMIKPKSDKNNQAK